MNYQIQYYLVYLIVGIVFYLFTESFWKWIFSFTKKKEFFELKKNLYEHNCGKCKIKN
jgi:hypothetical protein